MRILRTTAVCLFCLVFTLSSQAQFGKLKGLKDKLTKPDLGVQRQAAPSPEVKPVQTELQAGKTQEVTIGVGRIDATEFDGVEDNDPQCLTSSNFKVVSPTEIKVTVQTAESAVDTYCGITLKSTVSRQFVPVRWMVRGIKEAKFEPMMVGSEEMFAAEWHVKLPGGKTDVWKRTKLVDDNHAEYTNAAGQKLTFEVVGPMAQIHSANKCMYTAAFGGEGRAEFYPISGPCGVPVGSKLKATASK